MNAEHLGVSLTKLTVCISPIYACNYKKDYNEHCLSCIS